ncbi:MAG: aminotransferase class V-fold PLP-dependent enzyme [Candidatus Heimdallarchaeota archaeon]|nr:aminotransferase class V-fold PLP-dependent enzyme [Candidatus Heimdallarchaeota archaeon]
MSLDSDLTYLNHAAVGIWPKKSYQIYRDRMEAISSKGEMGLDIEECLAEVGALFSKFGKLINCEASSLGLTNSTSDGMHHFATGFHPDKLRGKNIILNDLEFIANSIIWQQMAKKNHMEIKLVKSIDGRLLLEDFEKAIDDDTSFVAISSVQFSNGFRMNMKELTDMTHNHGAYMVVDAIQHVGALQLDTRGLDLDFVTVGGYKWLLGPYGTGLTYVKPELQEVLDPVSITWHGQENFFDMSHHDYLPAKTGQRFSTMGAIHPAIFALSSTLDHHLKWGPAKTEQYLYHFTDHIVNRFQAELPEFILISPRQSRSESSQILSFKPTMDIEMLINHLHRNNIVCSMREGNLRIAPHVYSTHEDIETLISTIKQILN